MLSDSHQKVFPITPPYLPTFRRSGKCIGEKNIKAFYWFTSLLCFQTYYLMGTFIYYIVYLAASAPTGDKF